MTTKDRSSNYQDRSKLPEPVIPKCSTCHQPVVSCNCTDNILKK